MGDAQKAGRRTASGSAARRRGRSASLAGWTRTASLARTSTPCGARERTPRRFSSRSYSSSTCTPTWIRRSSLSAPSSTTGYGTARRASSPLDRPRLPRRRQLLHSAGGRQDEAPATHHGRRAAHVRQGEHDGARQGRGRRLEQPDRVPHPSRALDRAQLRRRPAVSSDQRRAIRAPAQAGGPRDAGARRRRGPEDADGARDVARPSPARDRSHRNLHRPKTWRAARPSLAGRGPRARHRDGGAGGAVRERRGSGLPSAEDAQEPPHDRDAGDCASRP